jgi:hypothetical protein
MVDNITNFDNNPVILQDLLGNFPSDCHCLLIYLDLKITVPKYVIIIKAEANLTQT